MCDSSSDGPLGGAAFQLRSKVPRLTPNARAHKRPLLRIGAIESTPSGNPHEKCIYVSAITPVLSAVKQIERLLRTPDKPAKNRGGGGGEHAPERGANKRTRGPAVASPMDIAADAGGARAKKTKTGPSDAAENVPGTQPGQPVFLKASGKAIDRALRIALFLQNKVEYEVRLKTGTVGTVDDLSGDEEDRKEKPAAVLIVRDHGDRRRDAAADAAEERSLDADDELTVDDDGDNEDDAQAGRNGKKVVMPLAVSRMRNVSTLEVAVRLR